MCEFMVVQYSCRLMCGSVTGLLSQIFHNSAIKAGQMTEIGVQSPVNFALPHIIVLHSV